MPSEPTISVIHIVREAKGGMRKHVLQLMRGLDCTRFRLGLVGSEGLISVFQGDGNDGSNGIDVLELNIGDGLGVKALLSAPRIAGFVRRKPAPRVVHAHGYTAALLGAIIARLTGSRLVYTAHNLLSPSSSRVNRMAALFASKRAARIIAVSKGVKDSLVKAGADPARIVVIPNGVEVPESVSFDRSAKLAEIGISSDAAVVLCVARLTPVKGVRFLIEAVPLVKKAIPNAAVIIAGDGPEMGSLRDLDRQVNHKGDGVVFLGHRDDVPELLAVSDVVTIPSVQEGQGLVALEAMAACRPVVATNVGGLGETIRDGITGLLVTPEDASALAAALVRVLSDEQLAGGLATAGRESVSREMTVEKMISATEAIYRLCARL
jgi:glycosyltransferase involved in cell wall biosynthesis